ncbi:MAG: DUF2851 family protein [Bacteroidaceae bacterium]|nr:DUF2851 family protein [Bacteroidaceae bacterium]
MEKLLHYIWKQRILPLKELRTTDGQPLEILDQGLHNHDAGPDFFNAKLKIGGTLWVGNVELHLRSSDWFRHGHEKDAAYNSVILHVVCEADREVETADGRRLPQMELPIPDDIRQKYNTLRQTEDYPRCWHIIPSLPSLTVHSWMSALLFERLQQRSERCLSRLDALHGDWERMAWVTLSRNFGFGINGDPFEQWATQLPLHACAKHRDDLFQLEALFLGTAGLLTPESIPNSAKEAAEKDDYLKRLRAEYTYLSHKFSLNPPMPAHLWRFLRLRPLNFPHLRLVQLARLYNKETAGFNTLIQASSREELHKALDTAPSDYWQSHYLFGLASKNNAKCLSATSRDLIIINTVVPLLFAHGIRTDNEEEQTRAISILEQLKPEANYIIRQWQKCGLNVESAADSQALIQLKREYCDRIDCLRCRFGFEYLKRQS